MKQNDATLKISEGTRCTDVKVRVNKVANGPIPKLMLHSTSQFRLQQCCQWAYTQVQCQMSYTQVDIHARATNQNK